VTRRLPDRGRNAARAGGESREICFPKTVYTAAPAANSEFRSKRFRLTYSSAVTPETVYECDMDSAS
jgi:oligopeptidase B